MSEILVGLISGFIFGLGLCLSGLADPSVVELPRHRGRVESSTSVRHGRGTDCDADWLSPRIWARPAALVAAF